VSEQTLSNVDHSNPIDDFACNFPKVKFTAGTKIFSRQPQPAYFFYLLSGTVMLSQTSENGQTVNLHVFHPGSCVSLLSLTGASDQYEFETIDAVEAYQIPREMFLLEARKNAMFTFELLLHAMRGMKGLLHRVEHAATASALQRVASVLSYFAKHQAPQTIKNGVIPIEVTHQEIADWLGLTRENVSLQLKKLEDDAVVKRHQKRIEIIDLQKLLQLGSS